MILETIDFVGMGLYFISTLVFLYLFLRTLRTQDGIGLLFLRVLTFGLFISSIVTFFVRLFSIYGNLSIELARTIASINPLVLLLVGLYLNYLFHHPGLKKNTDSKNIKEIKADAKEVKQDVKEVKEEIIK